MSIEKFDLICPVRSIEVVRIKDLEFFFISLGPYIRCYSASNGVLQSQIKALENESIHGIITTSKNGILGFGDKYIVEVIINDNIQLEKKQLLGPLDDLVLNCHYLRQNQYNTNNILLIGYAHNFIDIFLFPQLEDYQANASQLNDNIIFNRRINCIPCVLFCMSFFSLKGHIEDLIIASGTAFGKIYLWTIPVSPNQAIGHTDIVQTSTHVNSYHTLTGHEGVIFRLKWHASG